MNVNIHENSHWELVIGNWSLVISHWILSKCINTQGFFPTSHTFFPVKIPVRVMGKNQKQMTND